MEREPQPTKSFGEVEREIKGRGFEYAGQESLTKTTLGKNARFTA